MLDVAKTPVVDCGLDVILVISKGNVTALVS
jgi:hypothetical protein